jgi:multiple sugar transport system ATP-binding protein
MGSVEFSHVVKRYGSVEVISDLSLKIEEGQFVALVGPSGCGKSTSLRMIAGLEEISAGDILIQGKRVNDWEPKKRNIAMVFQNYALYPHMTVRQNIGLNLKISRMPKSEIEKRVQDAAELLDIVSLLDRRPSQLSGGQRQRVAMGRAIVRDPSVFLFDEPLSNLDALLRVQMRGEIKRFHKKTRKTTIYVTHDQIEAMTLADRVVVMDKGAVAQMGRPEDLYEAPQNLFVAGFIGSPRMNLVPARLVLVQGGYLSVVFDGGQSMTIGGRIAAGPADRQVIVGMRPEHLTACPGDKHLKGRVILTEFTGANLIATLDIDGREITCLLESHVKTREGAEIGIAIADQHVHIFDPETGLRIERQV